jgi:hypothetical protein
MEANAGGERGRRSVRFATSYASRPNLTPPEECKFRQMSPSGQLDSVGCLRFRPLLGV